MHCHAKTVVFLLAALSAVAQTGQTSPSSDSFANSLAQKSVAALTAGVQISDVTLSGSVTSVLGGDRETGTATLQAQGLTQSRVDLNLSASGMRSDVRNMASGSPGGAWTKSGNPATSYPVHNCWTDAAWFFPALSSLTQTANPRFVFKYIGQEQHRGVATQHIQIFQLSGSQLNQHLSTEDFYLDPASSLPLAIGFALHPDTSSTDDVPAEILFMSYQRVNGIEVPFHIQRLLNGGVVLDVVVTSAAFNSGLPNSQFILQ